VTEAPSSCTCRIVPAATHPPAGTEAGGSRDRRASLVVHG
jgi:hypothetical protein